MTSSRDTEAAGPALPATLAMLSHEFRTPLNGVLGMARLLETTRLTAEQRSYVEALKTSGDHLLGLVNDLLDLARLDAGQAAPDLAVIAVEPLLQQVCELLSPRAHEKGIEIAWSASPGLQSLRTDEGRLRQILLNFAGNAIKFTAQGGVLVAAEQLDDDRVRFLVRDTGPGIEADIQDSLFEPFAQGELGAKAGGAGLGLAIVRRLAASLGGEASVVSAPGQGAEFRFEAGFEIAPAAQRPSLEGRRVAVISPNPVLRDAVSRQLQASGAQALPVDRFEAAPEADVRLVDHVLLHGRRALRPPAGAPAIALIRPEDRHRIEALKSAGWAGYLVKPVRRDSLEARIRAALDSGAGPDRGPAEDERAAAAAAPGARVLLAEDNPINALLASALLEREGCIVSRVADGAAALAALAEQSFDLILMDVRMPGLGGLEAVRRLRAKGVVTPVAAFTADAFDDDRRACLAAGMDDFLVKPLTPPALRAVLARWTGPGQKPSGWTERPPESKLAS